MTPPAGDPLAIALGHLAAGRTAQARALLMRAVARAPGDPAINDALATCCLAEGDHARAIFYAERSAAARPESAESLAHLGTALAGAGRHDDAEATLRRALAIEPSHAEASFALVAACFSAGRFAAAEVEARRARNAAPHDRGLAVKHAAALLHLGRADEAFTALRAQMLDHPDDAELAEGLCTLANYAADVTAGQVLALHQNLGRLLAGQGAPPPLCPPGSPRRTPQGTPVRLGIISPDLHEHSVSYFVQPLLHHLDRSRFELVVFDTGHPGHEDATTKALRAHAQEWHPVYATAPRPLAQFIHGQTIDLLLDLSGLTAGHRLHTLRFRPAPVQVTWCGYPSTTGCEFIDARIVDHRTDPPGTSAAEALVRIDPCFLAYGPPVAGPAPGPAPARPGQPVFGSFNALTKITDRTLALWRAVLQAVPGATLLLKNRECRTEDVRTALKARLRAAGIDPGRVEIMPPTAGTREHLACYQRMDVALDTFPYHGTTTTCEALASGVPVVSLIGDRHASRVGLSLLTAAGFPEWAAPDEASFVKIAAALAADAGRTDHRAGIAAGVRGSALCDGAAFADRMSSALISLLERR
ncbi:MAG: O-linked N-acetylglucosamine transferase, SPINDLY family protein [Phycisphaerales bacterium]